MKRTTFKNDMFLHLILSTRRGMDKNLSLEVCNEENSNVNFNFYDIPYN